MAQVIIEYEEYQKLLNCNDTEKLLLIEALTEIVRLQGQIALTRPRVMLEIKNNRLSITRI